MLQLDYKSKKVLQLDFKSDIMILDKKHKPKPKGAITMKNLENKVREYKEMKRLAEEAQAVIDSIADEIKAEMTAQGVSEMDVDIFKIRWTPITSERLDTTALKNELPDIAARFTKTSHSRRFVIA